MLAIARDNRGFSGLELLIGLTLLLATVGVAYEFLTTGQRTAVIMRHSLFSQGQVRAGIDNMTDEIRWASSVSAASATSVTLQIPSNTPFSLGPYAVTFAYNAAAQAITRQVSPNPAAAVAYYIVKPDGTAGLSFDYYDKSSNSLGQSFPPGDISAIARIRLTVTATRESSTRILVGDASLRGQ